MIKYLFLATLLFSCTEQPIPLSKFAVGDEVRITDNNLSIYRNCKGPVVVGGIYSGKWYYKIAFSCETLNDKEEWTKEDQLQKP